MVTILEMEPFYVPVWSNASLGWRSILKGRAIIEDRIKWREGNGRTINFLFNWWVKDKPLELRNGISISEDHWLDTICSQSNTPS